MSSIGAQFRALHEQQDAFVIPNPWDVGSARMLAGMGFKALATTSSGMAFSMGKAEGSVSWDKTRAHCQALVEATPLPVSADLEKGMGDSPESVADTVRAAAAIGLAGCSIEDFTGDPDNPIYDAILAEERILAGVEACQSLPVDFVFTARCENLLWGRPNLDDVIKRLQAFDRAGADVLYAPGLRDLDEIAAVCEAVSKPVNVLMGESKLSFTTADLSARGVKRISVGSAFSRLAYGIMIGAARQILETGHYGASQPEPNQPDTIKIASFTEIEALIAAAIRLDKPA